MSSRRATSKLRPTDPGFWTVEIQLLDPVPVSKIPRNASSHDGVSNRRKTMSIPDRIRLAASVGLCEHSE